MRHARDVSGIDSQVTLERALSGKLIPDSIKASQALLNVRYRAFEGGVRQGQLVIHRQLQRDVREIFEGLLSMEFPIQSVIPVSAFGWSDDDSMAANNTVGFDYRRIAGTDRLSKHATGAIDINPLQNPHIKHGVITPALGRYDIRKPGTVTPDGAVVRLFKDHGFAWGGNWQSLKDYMHFERSE